MASFLLALGIVLNLSAVIFLSRAPFRQSARLADRQKEEAFGGWTETTLGIFAQQADVAVGIGLVVLSVLAQTGATTLATRSSRAGAVAGIVAAACAHAVAEATHRRLLRRKSDALAQEADEIRRAGSRRSAGV